MSAGLPGLGLGGLFFVVTALIGPFAELARTARGRGSVAAWRETLRQFAMAVAMIAVFELVRRAADGLISGSLELRSVAVTVAVLAAVLCAAKLLEVAVVVRRRFSRRSGPEPRRYGPAPRLQTDPEG